MGQERFLQGAELVHKPYRAWNKDWEQDHCAFCTRKFVEAGRSQGDAVTIGYAAVGRGPEGQDDYHWVCEACFADFRHRFQWRAVPPRD
jgi:hypothetical protein